MTIVPFEIEEPLKITIRNRYKSLRQVILIVLSITLASFYFGYCISYMASIPINTLVPIYSITLDPSVAQGILNGIVRFGSIFGAISCSQLISRLSRRQCLLFTSTVAAIVNVLIFVPNMYSLILCRFLQGICVGLFATLSSLITKEIAPLQISGSLGAIPEFLVGIGISFGFLNSYILKKITGDLSCASFWQIIFAFPLITLGLQSFVLVFVFPFETPKYWLLKEKLPEAKQLIEELYNPEFVDEVLKEIKEGLAYQQIDSSSNGKNSKISGIPDSKVAVAVAFNLALIHPFCGGSTVVIYSGSYLGNEGQLAMLMPFLLNLLKTLSSGIASFLLGRLGRRPLIQRGILSLMVADLLLTVGFFLLSSNHRAGQFLIIFGSFTFMILFGLTLSPGFWLYAPEIVQPHIIPYTTATQAFSATLLAFLFPVLRDHLMDGNPAPVFFFFASCCLASYLFNEKFMVETKDKAEQQIRLQYSSKRLCE